MRVRRVDQIILHVAVAANLVDLGLIYDVHVEESGEVRVRMTLTTPACPYGEVLVNDAKGAVETVEGASAGDEARVMAKNRSVVKVRAVAQGSRRAARTARDRAAAQGWQRAAHTVKDRGAVAQGR